MLQYHLGCQAALFGGRRLILTRLGARRAGPPARGRSRLFLLVRFDRHRGRRIGADRRRKHVERKAVVATAVHSRGGPLVLIVIGVIRIALLAEAGGAVIAATVAPIVTVAAVTTIASFLALLGLAVGLSLELLAIVVIVTVVTALAALVLESGAILAEHAEIMVRILQIIFGLHAVARELGVARQALVFFEQLSGVPALTIVLAVPRLTAEVLASLPSTAATAAALSLIDQTLKSLI